jgi:hypothetical protein
MIPVFRTTQKRWHCWDNALNVGRRNVCESRERRQRRTKKRIVLLEVNVFLSFC